VTTSAPGGTSGLLPNQCANHADSDAGIAFLPSDGIAPPSTSIHRTSAPVIRTALAGVYQKHTTRNGCLIPGRQTSPRSVPCDLPGGGDSPPTRCPARNSGVR
jgi:hypothetical protein